MARELSEVTARHENLLCALNVMSRMNNVGSKIIGIAIALAVVIWAILYITKPLITEKDALGIANARMVRSGQQLGFDVTQFQGPQLIPVDHRAYAFKWVFSDHEGAIDVLVWVDETGASELSWKGNLERLRTRK